MKPEYPDEWTWRDRLADAVMLRRIHFGNFRARWRCRLLGHSRVLHGAIRDICIDCLGIVDEHPEGRGR